MRPSVLLVVCLVLSSGCNLFRESESVGGSDLGQDVGDFRDAGRDGSVAPTDMPRDTPPPLDMGVDIGAPDMMAPDACSPESDGALCAGASANCGALEVTDSCGGVRTLDCGVCVAPQTCGAETDNVCGCVAEDDAAFCSRLGKNCGTVVDVDDCGQVRTTECGVCTAPQTCGQDGICACVPETDQAFCGRLGKDCEMVSADDNCGMPRTADCGTCQAGTMCGSTVPNVCGCSCSINGTCYGEGATNPNNPCEVCDSGQSNSAWTADVGASCDDGDGCTTSDQCDANGSCAGAAVVCDAGSCADSVCDPSSGMCITTPKPDLSPCADDGAACTSDLCNAGICEHTVTTGCFIDGVCYDNNFTPDSCRRCKAGIDATQWSVASGCAIDGACFVDGADNPANPCEVCTETVDQFAWTEKPDGRPCAPNQACLCMANNCEDAMSGGACTSN